MTTLRNRLAKLEANRPALPVTLTIDVGGLDPDAQARILQAAAGGDFPQSLSDDDLEAVMNLMAEQEETA